MLKPENQIKNYILNQKFQNAAKFWKSIYFLSDFEKIMHRENHVWVHFTPGIPKVLHFSFFFEKYDFELKVLQRVWFWIERNTMP